MGFKTIDYVTSFELRRTHTFALKRLGGVFTDTLEVKIDDQQVLLTQIGIFDQTVKHSQAFVVDYLPVELLWKWSPFTGDPKYIVLRSERQPLATYGSKSAFAKLALDITNAQNSPKEIAAVRLLRDELLVDRTEEVAREEFPLNNLAGSDTLTVEHEISRTLSSTLTLTVQEQIEGRIKGNILSVIESQIAGHLSQTTSHAIGESVTRRQRLGFSVKPGDAVLYTVVWKVHIRQGACHVEVDGVECSFPYQARFGLSFEIDSRPLGQAAIDA